MSDVATVDENPGQERRPSVDAILDAPIRRDELRKQPNRVLEVLWLVLGIAAIGGVVYGGAVLLGSTVLSPQAWAARYVTLIADGDFAAASERVDPQLDPTQADLLNSAVPSHGIQDVVVTPISENGPSAKVHVAFTLDGVPQESELSLWRRTSFFGLASEWRVSTALLGSVRLMSSGPDALSVGGVDVAVPGEAVFPAYPGVYPVDLTEADRFFELTAPVSAVIPANNTVEVPVTVTTTSAYDEGAQAAVVAIIDECASSGDIAPIGCPFGAVLFDEYRNLTWRITDYPVVEISDDGTRFESTSRGRAYAKFEQENFAGRGWVAASYVDKFHVTGTLTVADGVIIAAFDDGAGGTVG